MITPIFILAVALVLLLFAAEAFQPFPAFWSLVLRGVALVLGVLLILRFAGCV